MAALHPHFDSETRKSENPSFANRGFAGDRGGVSAASYLVVSIAVGMLAAAFGAALARVQG
jgi:hypothetical protein